MNVDLEKDDLVNLVSSVGPNYPLMEDPNIKALGQYNGSYGHWDWDPCKLKGLSEKELIKLYFICKTSWNQ